MASPRAPYAAGARIPRRSTPASSATITSSPASRSVEHPPGALGELESQRGRLDRLGDRRTCEGLVLASRRRPTAAAEAALLRDHQRDDESEQRGALKREGGAHGLSSKKKRRRGI